MELILEKLAPPILREVVSRTRLLELLTDSLRSYAGTVVHGRARTGKTVLAADFAHSCDRLVAWYKVDAPDVNLDGFLRYLIAGIASKQPGFGSGTLARLVNPSARTDQFALADSFAYDLQKQEEPLLVVIDDLHLVYDADWVVPFFRRLLPLLTAEVHLLILARCLPPTPLWRLRSKQRLAVFDESALAFNLSEAQQLFDSYGLPFESARSALDQTRGRAGALAAIARQAAVRDLAGLTTPSPAHLCTPMHGDYT